MRSGLLRFLRRALAGLAILVLLAVAAFWVLDIYFEGRLPPIQSVADYQRDALQMSVVHAADGTEIGRFWTERRTLVGIPPGPALPPEVLLAAVAAEDGDFYHHDGLDFAGMLRALYVNIRDGRWSQGGSTITQQVARTFYLTGEKTLSRKIEEVFLARKLERHLTKDDILVLYLNQIYFGHGRYGIEEAARYYLGKSAYELGVSDATLLMALLPAPEHLNPFDDLERCLERRTRILGEMRKRGFISAAQERQALETRPRLAGRAPPPELPARYFVDAARRRVEAALGADAVRAGGLRIFTTVEPAIQRAAHEAVQEQAASKRWRRGQDPPQSALVVLDPRSREVLALVGGNDFGRSPFNRAVQARRQVGSTFKTFVFGAGLEDGTLTPRTSYPNKRVSFTGANGRWRPSNADGKHDGRPTTIRDALRRSLNVVAVQALRDVGVDRLSDFARRAGVRSEIPADLSAALGSAQLSPLELANAYATIAAGGVAGDPVIVRRVEDRSGRVLYAEQPLLRYALSPATCEQLASMLRGAVEEGSGRRAAIDGLAVAGKTGTTSKARDAWFAGFATPAAESPRGQAPSVVAVAWVGYDDGRPLPRGSTGGSLAAPMWRRAVLGWLAAGSEAADTASAVAAPTYGSGDVPQ